MRNAPPRVKFATPRGWMAVLTAGILTAGALQASLPPVQPLPRPMDYSTPGPRVESTERLVYEFGWAGLPAAQAEWTSLRRPTDAGEVFEVTARARTHAAVDLLWKMRDEVSATVQADPVRPRQYFLKQRENSLRRTTRMAFDHDQGRLDIRREDTKKGKVDEKSLPPDGVYDPVSAAMALRGLDLQPGQSVPIVIHTGKSAYRLDLAVAGRERVRVAAGEFDALVLVPTVFNLEKGRPSERLRSARLWVSDDPRRVVLKVQSEVFIGSIYAELVRMG